MNRSVKLTVSQAEQTQVINGISAYRATLTLSNAVNIQAQLFVVIAEPTDEDPDRTVYRCVATPADVANLTTDAPPAEEPGQPFLVSSIEVLVDDHKQIDELVTSVRRRLKTLIDTLKVMDVLGSSQEFTISG